MKDQQRTPGPGEKRHLLQKRQRAKICTFGLVGDYSKAHRRITICPRDHGFQRCSTDPDARAVWVNRVACFGMGSSAYWWSRVAGALLRLAYYMVDDAAAHFEALCYADDLELLVNGKADYAA